MKVRRIIIVILAVINAGLIFVDFGMKTGQEPLIQAENVTVNKNIIQESSMEHPDFIKEDYVLVLPEGENLARGKKVKANSFADVYTPRKVTDGVATGVSYWEAKAESYPNVITVDLEENLPIHAIRICLSPMAIWGKRTQTFSVQISEDKETFTELIPEDTYTFDPDTGNEVQLHFDEVNAQYVQLVFSDNSGAAGAQIAEFEIYGQKEE